MSQSLDLQVQLAIVALLMAEGSPAANVDLASTDEYTLELMPAYNLAQKEFTNDYDRDADNESLAVDAEYHLLCYACRTDSQSVREAVDPLLVFAHKQLADSSLGGLVRSLRVSAGSMQYDSKDGNGVIEVALRLLVTFDISRVDSSINSNEGE